MGGKSSQSNSTDQSMAIINSFVAEQQEKDRQSRIKQGLSRVDGAFRGFDDNYFRNYATLNSEAQMPQAEEQYADAQNELAYRLARAGTGSSSIAATNIADLAKQNHKARAQVLNNSDQAASNLRSRVNSEKNALIGQLYSSSDPDMAANAALTSSKGIGADQPSYSPLGQMFNVAAVGGANFMNGFNQGSAYKNAGFGGSGGSSGRVVK